jgi:hypothetical protein
MCYMSRPSHPPLFHYSNYTWRRVQLRKFLFMQFFCNLLSPHPNILLSTLFSNTFSLVLFI